MAYQIWSDKRNKHREEIRAQANNVAAWIERYDAEIINRSTNEHQVHARAFARNNNLTPIYDVVVSVVGLHGAGPSEHGEVNPGDYPCRVIIPQLPSGLWNFWINTEGKAMGGLVFVLEIAFKDGNGKSWIRRGNGELLCIASDPPDYYSIPQPCDWTRPTRITLSQ